MKWQAYTTTRLEEGRIHWLEDHFQRLQESAHAHGSSFPSTLTRDALFHTLRARGAREESWRLRLLIDEEGGWEVELTPYQELSRPRVLLPFPQPFPPSLSSEKVGKREAFREAFHWAQNEGADDALLLTEEGWLREGAIHNLFWLAEDFFYCPAPSTGALKGVALRAAQALAHRQGLQVREVEWRLEELFEVRGLEGLFVTNSLHGILPVERVGEKGLPLSAQSQRWRAAYFSWAATAQSTINSPTIISATTGR